LVIDEGNLAVAQQNAMTNAQNAATNAAAVAEQSRANTLNYLVNTEKNAIASRSLSVDATKVANEAKYREGDIANRSRTNDLTAQNNAQQVALKERELNIKQQDANTSTFRAIMDTVSNVGGKLVSLLTSGT